MNRYWDEARQTITKWAIIDPIVAIVLLLTLFSSIKVVGVGQVGVVTRFGNITREWDSGIHVKLPFIEKVEKFDVRVQKEDAQATAATNDLQDVTATLALNYRLERGQVGNVFRSVGPLYKERLIDPGIQEVFKATSAKYTASQLITGRSEVKADVLKQLRERLEPKGIFVDDLSIVNFGFSPEFNKAIEAKQVTQQQAEQAKYQAEVARNQAQAAIESARGQAEAQRLQQQTLTAELLQKYAIDKWNGAMPTYLGGGSVFNIPLTK